MRLALVSLIALTAAANAVAQPTTPVPPSPPPAPPAASPDTPPVAPPAANAAQETPPATQPEQEAPPALPPPPPAPPTDPTAIAVLNVLQKVCIPSANGGNLDQLAKAAGYRKSGEDWTLRQHDFSMTVESPGSNPTQCHVDITHPVDQQAPGRPIIVALHDWAAVTNGWSLYRNDKNVEGGQEFTTRSWQHDANGKSESVVFTTTRHADDTPMQRSSDTSQLIYGVTSDAS